MFQPQTLLCSKKGAAFSKIYANYVKTLLSLITNISKKEKKLLITVAYDKNHYHLRLN